MLFPKIDVDNLVQINDMFRICGIGSFFTADETLQEIKIYPNYVVDPLITFSISADCPDDYYLDWAYDTAGDYEVRIELVADSGTTGMSQTVTAVTVEEDNLQADDQCIYAYESELKKYQPSGRNSYKYILKHLMRK